MRDGHSWVGKDWVKTEAASLKIFSDIREFSFAKIWEVGVGVGTWDLQEELKGRESINK